MDFCSSFRFFFSFRFSTFVHSLGSLVKLPSNISTREGEEGCPNPPKEVVAVGPNACVADEVELSESTGTCCSFATRVDIVWGGWGGETFFFLNDRCDVGEPCDGRFGISQGAYNCLC